MNLKTSVETKETVKFLYSEVIINKFIIAQMNLNNSDETKEKVKIFHSEVI
jgi:hypothetical protein